MQLAPFDFSAIHVRGVPLQKQLAVGVSVVYFCVSMSMSNDEYVSFVEYVLCLVFVRVYAYMYVYMYVWV